MNRRMFLLASSTLLLIPSKKFKFRIRTKSGGLIGTTEQASNMDAAKVKVRKRYPDCEFLSSEEVK